MRAWWIAPFVGVMVACGGDDEPRCASPADCELGNVCINGRCVSADTDGGADASQDGGDDVGPPDSGTDAGDAGRDATMDARVDAADAALDAPPDTFDAGPLTCPGPGGVDDEPIVLYTFQSPDDAVMVTDRAPAAPNVPLTDNTGTFSVDNAGTGSVTITSGQLSANAAASDELVAALVAAGSFSVEVWFSEADILLEEESGPERIVTLSESFQRRAFTMGQTDDALTVRVKTDTTWENGFHCDEPVVGDARPPVAERMIFDVMDGTSAKQVVLVFDEGEGRPVIYVNGVEMGDAWPCRRGSIDWMTGLYRLALGNEFDSIRNWEGTIHRVAIYSRALSGAEVSCWHGAGPDADVFL